MTYKMANRTADQQGQQVILRAQWNAECGGEDSGGRET